MELRARSINPEDFLEENCLEEERFIMLPRETPIWFQVYLGNLAYNTRLQGLEIPVHMFLKKATRLEAVALGEYSGTYRLSSIEREEAMKSRDKALVASLNRDLAKNFIQIHGVQFSGINIDKIMEGNLIVGFPLPPGTMLG